LPPPHSTFGGCGLPHCQIAEKQKTYDNGSKKHPDPSVNYWKNGNRSHQVPAAKILADSVDIGHPNADASKHLFKRVE
jgi:hypothetical protein